MSTSTGVSLKLPGMNSIKPSRYWVVTAAALYCLITLYPSPSSLFHLLFLPSLIISEKYDKRVCSVLTLILDIVLTLTLYGGTSESPVLNAVSTQPLAIVDITLIYTHRKVSKLFQARAWTRAVTFGILWSATSALITHTMPGAHRVSLNGPRQEARRS